jgi:hypothetical protein
MRLEKKVRKMTQDKVKNMLTKFISADFLRVLYRVIATQPNMFLPKPTYV